MGSSFSKRHEEDDMVSRCRQRKRQLKLAIERRYTFADAHCKYYQSLHAVADAIRLFVERSSSPSPSFIAENPVYLQLTSILTKKIIPFRLSDSETSTSSSEVEREKPQRETPDDSEEEKKETEKEEEGSNDIQTDMSCEHSHEGSSTTPSSQLESARKVRHVGTAEDVSEGDCASVNQGEDKGPRVVIDKPKALLEALKDVADCFLKAYDSGLDVSRLLETNEVQNQSALKEIKENSSKLIRSITRSRSISSKLSWSSFSKSTSRSSSTWTRSGLFDDYGAVGSGCQSITLVNLEACENKLFEELKDIEETVRSYEQTTRHSLKARISVAVRNASLISGSIAKLRDEELQAQLVKLIQGLRRSWKIMSESHETQSRIMSQVKSLNRQSYDMLCNDSIRLATLELKAKLRNWRACFDSYVCSQKAYVEALRGWLCEFVTPETEFSSQGQASIPRHRVNGPPPSLTICDKWLAFLDELPDEAVTSTMKSFEKNVCTLIVLQGKEHQQKRKVEQFQRKVSTIERRRKKVVAVKLSKQESKLYLNEMKGKLKMVEKRVEEEKKKLDTSMEETKNIAVKGFQEGFSPVFASLAEFFKECCENI